MTPWVHIAEAVCHSSHSNLKCIQNWFNSAAQFGEQIATREDHACFTPVMCQSQISSAKERGTNRLLKFDITKQPKKFFFHNPHT